MHERIIKNEIIVSVYLKNDYYYFMPRKPSIVAAIPRPVERAIKQLGEHLHIARKRRKESLVSFSARMMVSVPTLRKMEAGDPSVSIVVYASALWLIGRERFLGEIANPHADADALLLEIRGLSKGGGR